MEDAKNHPNSLACKYNPPPQKIERSRIRQCYTLVKTVEDCMLVPASNKQLIMWIIMPQLNSNLWLTQLNTCSRTQQTKKNRFCGLFLLLSLKSILYLFGGLFLLLFFNPTSIDLVDYSCCSVSTATSINLVDYASGFLTSWLPRHQGQQIKCHLQPSGNFRDYIYKLQFWYEIVPKTIQ